MLTERHRGVLRGVIDMHVHASPDVHPRKTDEIELVRRAKSVGMRGVLLKSHHALTADRAWLIRRIEPGIDVFGSLVLNMPSCGGLNPQAVETAIELGAKEIWMPTISSAHHIRWAGGDPKEGISLLSGVGEVLPEVEKILNIIAEADIILGTGHISVKESRVLVDTAASLGVKKILVTHPELELISMSIEVQEELAERGALMEHCYYPTTELGGGLDVGVIAEQVRRVGSEHCVMATDLGQVANPHPTEGMLDYIRKMTAHGISEQDIDVMTKRNPARMLGLS